MSLVNAIIINSEAALFSLLSSADGFFTVSSQLYKFVTSQPEIVAKKPKVPIQINISKVKTMVKDESSSGDSQSIGKRDCLKDTLASFLLKETKSITNIPIKPSTRPRQDSLKVTVST
jgi:hypothetical protein